MAEYAKMKNAELEALLKERNLPHTGKKADLIKRLQESDDTKKNDDEIDWDDEPAAASAAAATEEAKPTSEPAAAAIAAGGTGQPPNPQAVPNQVADIDPSKTNDLTVSQPDESEAPAQEASAEAPAAEAAPPVEEKPAVDFTSGLATTTLDQEIEKRKARAKKFGLSEADDATLKNLERAKKFGGTELPSKLNEALPEKRERKRARETPVEDGGARKKRGGQQGGQGRGGQQGGQGRGGHQGGQQQGARRNAPRAEAPKKEAKPAVTDADRAKAEARKARFG